MKTLFASYRVTDLDRSIDFYTALGHVSTYCWVRGHVLANRAAR